MEKTDVSKMKLLIISYRNQTSLEKKGSVHFPIAPNSVTRTKSLLVSTIPNNTILKTIDNEMGITVHRYRIERRPQETGYTPPCWLITNIHGGGDINIDLLSCPVQMTAITYLSGLIVSLLWLQSS